jgi:plasmid stabilization system protein ParE
VTKPIRTEPEAEEELVEAARWYERQRRGLGLEFLVAIGAAVELIQRQPMGGTPVPGVKDDVPAQRMVLRRFPYAVVFLELETEIRILAFAHKRRRPAYWQQRLRS